MCIIKCVIIMYINLTFDERYFNVNAVKSDEICLKR